MSFSPSLFPVSAPPFVSEDTAWPVGQSPRVGPVGSASSGPGASAMPRCSVCHSTELIRDEVFDGGALQLCECRRCEHRWTFRAPSSRVAASVRRSSPRGGGRRSGAIHAA